HCWTSWASCSNVSSASNPGAVTCATTLCQFLVNRGQPISACHTMERKVPPKCSLRHPPRWPEAIAASYSPRQRKTSERVPWYSVSDYGVNQELPIFVLRYYWLNST